MLSMRAERKKIKKQPVCAVLTADATSFFERKERKMKRNPNMVIREPVVWCYLLLDVLLATAARTNRLPVWAPFWRKKKKNEAGLDRSTSHQFMGL